MNFQDRKSFFAAFLIIALGGALFYAVRSFLPQRLFSEKAESESIVVDRLMLQAMSNEGDLVLEDSLGTTQDTLKTAPIPVVNSDKKPIVYTPARLMEIADFEFGKPLPADSTGVIMLPKPMQLKGYKGAEHLSSFYKKLAVLEQDSSKTVRIAYYGDSMIDGDLIVQDLRSALQNRFKGRGVGFVSMESESARSRYSVKHKTTGNWKQHSFMKSVSDSLFYGVNGAVFYAIDSTSQVSFKASGIKNAYRLNQPRLFYGAGNDSAQLHYTVNKDTVTQNIALNGTKNLNTVSLSLDQLKSLKLNFFNAQSVPLYGLDFFNNEGIVIDGFSNRGNSGLPLSLLNTGFIQAFNKELQYDLVVLQFGANVLSTQSQTFRWYSRRMARVIEHVKQLYPGADILIIGTADKGTKTGDLVQTDTTVVRLLRSQQEYAAQTGSGFLSLFHLMGGVNSMTAWEQHKLANADFTHFSPKGSRVMGKLIYDELLRGYDAAMKAFAKAEQLKKSLSLLKEKKKENELTHAAETRWKNTQVRSDTISKKKAEVLPLKAIEMRKDSLKTTQK
jgi:lysophospholipase L1-like esterase